MIKIGNYNTLPVVKTVDFGVYLDGGNGVEILLPARYVAEPLQPGDELEVFVYTDSEDRLIATTERPLITVGEFAYLRAVEVNKIGAFLDWGLPKDLLCPYREQRIRMVPSGEYLVYAYLDDTTKRIVASAKIEKFIGNTIPEYQRGSKVSALVWQRTDIGYRVIVDNLFYGMLYFNEVSRQLTSGEIVEAYVKNVRPDGKVDLTLKGDASDRIHALGKRILDRLHESKGGMPVGDASSPEVIRDEFGCSKKDFKKAVGHLFKSRVITVEPEYIRLASRKSQPES